MDNKLTEITLKFLEGKTTVEEESLLFSAIAGNEETANEFKLMEEKWRTTHAPSRKTLGELGAFRRMARRASRRNRMPFLRRHGWITGVVAAACLAVGLLVFRPFASKEPAVPAKDQTFSVEAPPGTHSKISLPDGTSVWLNAGSKISYDADFNTSNRNVSLVGEACFDVVHNKVLPLVVSASGCSFKVLGTKFNISAYEDDSCVMAALIEGSLQVNSPVGEDVLSKGEVVSVSSESLRKYTDDVAQYISWTEGNIRYNSIPVPELMRRLSREFNVDIVLQVESVSSRTMRVAFSRDDSIDDIMKAVCEILRTSAVKVGRSYYIVENNKSHKNVQ
ncbi:MAG: FecR domain-containing protein [Bacteroidales bacterium]|nr:FecR domain-containing protein [Bacteroidales bacterium]